MSDTKIAVFRPGALGDMILATPVLDALIRAHGDAGARLDLHVFVTMPHGSVLRAGEAEWGRLTVRDFGDRACAWLFGGSGPAPEILEESVGGADAVIAWLNDPDGIFRARIESLGARRIVIHTARPPLAAPDGDSRSLCRPVHASEHLWRALLDISDAASPQAEAGGAPGALGRTRFPPSPPVPAPESPSLRVRGAELRAGMSRLAALFPEPFEGGLAAIHPGSGGAAKRAPPEIFAAVARAVAAFGLRPFLIQGPADAEAVEAVLSAAAGRVADRMERRRSGGWRESGSGGGGSGPAPTDKVAGVPGRDEEPIPKHPMRSLLIEDDRFPGRRLPDRLEVLGSGKGCLLYTS
ncbi:MAG: hypothetical protein N3A38_05915, partial [Planctomycetota bacterium]|nr:hypothetical protein [Planctomycetota bacterium]